MGGKGGWVMSFSTSTWMTFMLTWTVLNAEIDYYTIRGHGETFVETFKND